MTTITAQSRTWLIEKDLSSGGWLLFAGTAAISIMGSSEFGGNYPAASAFFGFIGLMEVMSRRKATTIIAAGESLNDVAIMAKGKLLIYVCVASFMLSGNMLWATHWHKIVDQGTDNAAEVVIAKNQWQTQRELLESVAQNLDLNKAQQAENRIEVLKQKEQARINALSNEFAEQQAQVESRIQAWFNQSHSNGLKYSQIMDSNCTPLHSAKYDGKMTSAARELCPQLQALQAQMPSNAGDATLNNIRAEISELQPLVSQYSQYTIAQQAERLAQTQYQQARHTAQPNSYAVMAITGLSTGLNFFTEKVGISITPTFVSHLLATIAMIILLMTDISGRYAYESIKYKNVKPEPDSKEPTMMDAIKSRVQNFWQEKVAHISPSAQNSQPIMAAATDSYANQANYHFVPAQQIPVQFETAEQPPAQTNQPHTQTEKTDYQETKIGFHTDQSKRSYAPPPNRKPPVSVKNDNDEPTHEAETFDQILLNSLGKTPEQIAKEVHAFEHKKKRTFADVMAGAMVLTKEEHIAIDGKLSDEEEDWDEPVEPEDAYRAAKVLAQANNYSPVRAEQYALAVMKKHMAQSKKTKPEMMTHQVSTLSVALDGLTHNSPSKTTDGQEIVRADTGVQEPNNKRYLSVVQAVQAGQIEPNQSQLRNFVYGDAKSMSQAVAIRYLKQMATDGIIKPLENGKYKLHADN